MEETLYKHLIKTGRAVVNIDTCISCKSVGVIMHFSKILNGKRGVTDTTAWLVIQDGGWGVHVHDKIIVKPLLWTRFGIRYHRLRDITGENIFICCKLVMRR